MSESESETLDENALEQPESFADKPTHAQIIAGRVRINQENIRQTVVVSLLVITAAILTFSAWCSVTSNWPQCKDWLLIALPPMVGFLGAALGFYFSIIIQDEQRH